MEPSHRQQAALQAWTTTDSNILMNAVAGSGKSTTLMLLLESCKHTVLFLAFNKSIKDETEAKLIEKNLGQGKAMTMHGLGLAAIRGAYKFRINNNKNWDIIRKIQTQYKAQFKRIPYAEQGGVSYSLVDMNEVSRMYLTDDIPTIREHMKSMDKTLSNHPRLEEMWEIFLKLRAESYEGNYIEIDFADMIYLPILKDLTIPIYPYYLMIDEAQDLALCQHKLIDKLISQGTIQKWIAVGDRNQAIYGFSGATSNSFDMFLTKSDNVVEMPLDICYRSDTSIVEAANVIYPVMIAASTQPGVVMTSSNIDEIEENSMVICRNTAPLFELYFELLGRGKPCYINGSDIMAYLIKFLKPYIKHNVHSATIEMRYKYEDLQENSSEEGKFQLYIFEQNFENFLNVSTHVCKPTDSMEDVIEKLKHLFENRNNAIMLCTIHKSKGLESNTVYILNEHLIPSKFAKSEEQLIQEKNLKYVARTRAKNKLVYLNLKMKSDPKPE